MAIATRRRKRGRAGATFALTLLLAVAGLIGLNLIAALTASAQSGDQASGETAGDNGQAEGEGEAAGEASGEDQDVKLHSGSQAPYIHNINLYDASGTVIEPDSTTPYSPIKTCGKCHNTSDIRHGWHHNAADPDFENDGRKGEPYFWISAQTATQLPLTERDWPGTYDLDPLGISAWDFTIRFGGRTPGGGLGGPFQKQGAEDEDARWNLTGQLQANCLSCHLKDASWDFTKWNEAIEKHNFKWAPAAASPFAKVEGAMTDVPDDYNPMMASFGSDNPMPKTRYRDEWFDGNTLLLGTRITNDIPNQNCLQCHSKRPVGPNALPRWHRQQDIHMAQGMSCVDCHRNGIDHMTSRNFDGDPALKPEPVKTLTCKGCHMGGEDSKQGTFAAGGRMAAPTPQHKGIPPLHFHEMTCTSCHSGPNPAETTTRVQTSLGHKLGLSSEYRNHRYLPHMVSPVFLENGAGKLAPHRAVWPAFWGIKTAAESGEGGNAGDNEQPAATQPAQNGGLQSGATASRPITPLPPAEAAEALSNALPEPEHEGMWRSLSKQKIKAGLEALQGGDWGEGELVYVSGGKAYRLADGEIHTERHRAASAYAWPLAHDVRPANQSLGAGGCKDCHSPQSEVDFSMTAAAGWDEAGSPVPTLPQQSMHEMRGDSRTMLGVWNLLFQGRTAFKVLAIVSGLLVAGVLLLYAGLAIRGLSRRVATRPRDE